MLNWDVYFACVLKGLFGNASTSIMFENLVFLQPAALTLAFSILLTSASGPMLVSIRETLLQANRIWLLAITVTCWSIICLSLIQQASMAFRSLQLARPEKANLIIFLPSKQSETWLFSYKRDTIMRATEWSMAVSSSPGFRGSIDYRKSLIRCSKMTSFLFIR